MGKPKIIVTGAGGQVGMELQELSVQYSDFDFIFLKKADLPIHDEEAIKNYFKQNNPSYCINCAAYTAVDKAETEKETALQINGEAVGTLALVCRTTNTKLLHISTDYVFNGNATIPYKETDVVEPVNYYGYTKLKGEQLCIENNSQSIILRTSWVYSVYGNNFVKTMLRLMKERESINVVNDQVGSPTYAADLAKVILDIVRNSQQASVNWKAGIYHYSNDGIISWYEFAETIKELSGSKCNINPIPTSGYPTPASRPFYSVFDKQKVISTFGIEIPEWRLSLKNCLTKL